MNCLLVNTIPMRVRLARGCGCLGQDRVSRSGRERGELRQVLTLIIDAKIQLSLQ